MVYLHGFTVRVVVIVYILVKKMVIFIIFTYVYLYESVCGYMRASTCGTWKTASEFLRLESQVVVNCPVSVPGTEPGSSVRTVPALAH